MTGVAQKRLTVDDFLVWSEGRDGKWELHDGEPVAMSPERILHSRVKTFAAAALLNAIQRAGAPCGAHVDGPLVRARSDRAFIPDVVVVCPEAPLDDVVVSNPLIVVEVLSPSTAACDHNVKLQGYLSLASVAHYLILDPDRRLLIHHARGRADVIETRILFEGALRLDPPGLDVAVADLFGPIV